MPEVTLFHIFPLRGAVATMPEWWAYVITSILLFFALMYGLHVLPRAGKKWLMISTTFVAGLYFLLEYFLPIHKLPDGSMGNFITPTVAPTSEFTTIIWAWPILLGLISLALVHGQKLFKLAPGWHYSLAFFLAFFAMLIFGLYVNAPGWKTTSDFNKGIQFAYDSLFGGLLVNLDSAMFALLAFYIASAAYRAFRVRTLEAALLMIAALVVMLGVVKVGYVMTSWIPVQSPLAFFRIDNLSQWIMDWLNMPGQRAVMIGVAVGSLAMSMRLWLSLERGAFFSVE